MPGIKTKDREKRLRFVGSGRPRIIQQGEDIVDTQDAQIQAMINNSISQSSYLPLSGGTLSGALTLSNINIILGSGAGTKIGTATTQKLAFFNSSPAAQPSSTGQTAGFTAGAGSAAKDDSTFTGGSGTKAYTIGDIVKHLKALGLLASS